MNQRFEKIPSRKVWQILWEHTLGQEGFGYHDTHFENETFEVKPYYYNGEENDYHFYHKPSGFKIYWYKYALRGASCNQQITDEMFVDILRDCCNSLQQSRDCPVKITHDIDKWWENDTDNNQTRDV